MQWLETITELGQKTWNTVRAVGPFLVSQSDKASEAFQRHLGRLAEADALRELLRGEVETRSALRRTLLERYISASPEERIRIEQDIEFVDGTMRQFNTIAKSLSYDTETPAPPKPSEKPKPIEEHWLDRFNELARKRNEEWRSDLLARALARESATPGVVSPRALWLIGNMEQGLFTALSELLDLCIWMWPQGPAFLPNSKIEALQRNPDGQDANAPRMVGHLTFQLGDIGLISDHLTTARRYPTGSSFIVRYDQRAYIITAKQQLEIRGILLTPLGESIASFYQPRWNPAGLAVLADWIESLTPEQAIVQEAQLQQQDAGA